MIDNSEEDQIEGQNAAAETLAETREPAGVEESGATSETEPTPEVKVVDKRRFARLLGFGFNSASGAGANGSEDVGDVVAGERLPSYVAELKERAERVEAEARAEVEAARSRLERHYEARLASARADLVAQVLGVLDNLERALAVPGAEESLLYDGVVATRDLFLKMLAELGAEPVPSVGETFDPEIHEAIGEEEVDDPSLDGKIVEELQRGFRHGDRLVRPAVVRVGRVVEHASGSDSRKP
jgi:molecular chaperone GrpE